MQAYPDPARDPIDRLIFPALAILVLIWAALFWLTWAHWGSITVDSGREVYVPAQLAEGQTLYKDVWYLYGPLAPYANSVLFQIFGARLETAYWAGSLAALSSALFLLAAGWRAGFWMAGWCAGCLVLVQAFVPWIFCFPLPYSFASVYGCVAACAFLWAILGAAVEPGRRWLLAASGLACVNFLLKLEFGTAAYATLAAVTAARAWQRRNLRDFLRDLAAQLPGVAVSIAVVAWMIGLGGVDFLLQENIMSWPTSHFMQRYGAAWLARSGATLSPEMVVKVCKRSGVYLVFWLAVALAWRYLAARGSRAMRWAAIGIALADLALLSGSKAWLDRTSYLFQLLFAPLSAPFLVLMAGAAAAVYWVWKPASQPALQAAVACLFAGLLAFRILFAMIPHGYSIYYNAPAAACLAAAMAWWIAPRAAGPRAILGAQAMLGLTLVCFSAAVLRPRYLDRPTELLQTGRGAMYVPRSAARGYREALRFIDVRSKAGGRVSALPEDTGLYFLSGTRSPTRVFATTPGTLAPGSMTGRFIEEFDRSGVTDILWSNRTFAEYGATLFGTDFDRPVGDYIRERFEAAGSVPVAPDGPGDWRAVIWHRKEAK